MLACFGHPGIGRSLLPLSLLLAFAGCSEQVELGSFCPDPSDSCSSADGGMPVVVDASVPPADTATPAMPVPDAVVETPPDSASMSASVTFPPLSNGSFELTDNSVAGDVTSLSSTQINPWYTCQPIGGGANPTTAVRAETSVVLTDTESPAGATVMPTSGSTFINMGYLVNIVPVPLAQALSAPLEPGVNYAFAIDVQSPKPEALLSLQVRGTGSDSDCLNLSADLLAESAAVTSTGWQTLCIPFTTSAEKSHLVLSVKSAASLATALQLGTARLLFDNLRAATHADCPALL